MLPMVFSPDEKLSSLSHCGLRQDLALGGAAGRDGSRTASCSYLPGNDGMKVDKKGNLYAVNAVGPGEVWITSPEGAKRTWARWNFRR